MSHPRKLRTIAPALLVPALLASCTKLDLSDSCLPLKAPATVRLMMAIPADVGIHTDLRLNPPMPTRLDPILPVGTVLHVHRISQKVQFDTSNTDIEVFGELADGRTFVFRWGFGRTLYRAPWEPETTPQLRTATCAHN